MKVYIVTEGEYSDYHIEEVFSTREKAESYIALHNTSSYGYYQINEYEVDNVEIAKNEDIVQTCTATYVRNYATDSWTCDPLLDYPELFETQLRTRDCFIGMREDENKNFKKDFHRGQIKYTILADSPEKIRKIFQDRLAELNAMEQGIV